MRLFSLNGGFARFMDLLWSWILLSMLMLVCSIPVITTGAAITAGYYAAAKCLRHGSGTLCRAFFHSFRDNFLQGLVLTLIFGGILGVLILDCLWFYGDPDSLPMLYLFYGLVVLSAAVSGYAWACLSRFRMKTGRLLRMALLLPVRHLIVTVLLLLLGAACGLGLWLMPWGILVFPGLCLYLGTFLLEPVLKKYTPEAIPGQEKWYQI